MVRHYSRPVHLARFVRHLERVESPQGVFLIGNVPPQHGKTDQILLTLVRYLKRHPERTVAYVTYNSKRTHAVSRKARSFALRAGIQVPSDADALGHWYTSAGGGAIFTTVAGAELTGQGVHVLVIDDPHKTRAEAESLAERDRVWEFYTGVAVDRVLLGGSMIVTHTRWHPDDLTGRLLKEQPDEWTHVNLKAIADEDEHDVDGSLIRRAGESLWPEVWPAGNPRFEHQQKYAAYEWYSKYQGEPRPRGGAIFEGASLFDKLPRVLRCVGIGADVAYSGQGDWNALVVVGLGDDGRVYVLDVKRSQAKLRDFARVLIAARTQYPGAQIRWYGTPQEREIANLLREQGVPIVGHVTTKNKAIRAAGVAGAWNAGEVLLPRTGNALVRDYRGDDELPPPAWVEELVTECSNFKGLKGDVDDMVDALAAAFDIVAEMSGMFRPEMVGSQFGRTQVSVGKRVLENWNKPPADDAKKSRATFDW